MKKVISLILCLALFVSVLGVTALATTDNYIVHYRLEKAILTSSYSTRWHNFPANKSTATLIEDLYSDDAYANVSLFDTVEKYRDENVRVSVDKLFFYPDSTRSI